MNIGLENLDLEQKIRLLTGADFWSLPPAPELGLRRLVLSDGPVGVRGELWDERSTSANLPSPTALAASWDPDRVQRLGRLLAAECRRKGIDVLLAPNVNLQRSPYGGRHFEFFSEDPRLTAEIGAAYVRGLQSQGVGATVKHFVANDSETQRFTVDVRVSERALRELYLYPFEVVVGEAGVWAVMAAYNGVNGTTMTESPMLRSILQEEWDFDGVTMSDWYAARSTEPAARAGLDLIMPGPAGPWRDRLVKAVQDGRVSADQIDDKVRRMLRLAGRVGASESVDGTSARTATSWSNEEISRELRSAAGAGFVLLRNTSTPPDPDNLVETPLLPLTGGALHRVAVLGPNAAHGRTLGGGSALVFPPYTVSPLDGLRAGLPASVHLDSAPGGRIHTRLQPVDPVLLRAPDNPGLEGCEVQFLDAEGTILGSQLRRTGTFTWIDRFGDDVETALVSAVVVRTRLRVTVSGRWTIGASGLGRFRLTVDQQAVFDTWLEAVTDADPIEAMTIPPQHGAELELHEGQLVQLELRHEPASIASARAERIAANGTLVGGTLVGGTVVGFQLNVEPPYVGDDAEIQRAVTLAGAADVAVVVVGTTEEVESEGRDRTSLALPGRQDELVRRVAAANSRTVVVVNAGAPVLLPWRHQVPAVLLTWFPGQEFGNALADVLLGVVEPGGRLPTTWPDDEQAGLPSTAPIDGSLSYDEGLHIGYRRFLRDGIRPAYWFGHGLGYTKWEYGSTVVDTFDAPHTPATFHTPTATTPTTSGTSARSTTSDTPARSTTSDTPARSTIWDGEFTVRVELRNTGTRRGREVVQVYLSRPDSAIERPLRWLAGHAGPTANPGEKTVAEIVVPRRAFAHWDVTAQDWIVEPGGFELHVGRSVVDLISSTTVTPRIH